MSREIISVNSSFRCISSTPCSKIIIVAGRGSALWTDAPDLQYAPTLNIAIRSPTSTFGMGLFTASMSPVKHNGPARVTFSLLLCLTLFKYSEWVHKKVLTIFGFA